MLLTFRRHYLDRMLEITPFHGKVLDVGGKKENKRGLFRPPLEQVDSWEYLNIDASTNPDYCCSAENIPVQDETFEMVLMTEVLEHMESPQAVLKECYRILRREGQIVATIPFLYNVHADPDDFQRWTPEGIRREMTNAGFAVQKIRAMGSLFAVMYDLIRNSLGMASKNRRAMKNRLLNKFFMPILAKVFMVLDRKYEYKNGWITTGYYVVGKKV